MESLSHFRSINELVKVLDREKALINDMFERRKSTPYRIEFAMEMIEFKNERLQFLIDHGVIHDSGDFLQIEDSYQRFFEDVLNMNEEISVSSIKEQIDFLRENINYYLEENNSHRRAQYHGIIRKILLRIGLRTLKNVVDLKRGVDDAYKQEPNYKIKKDRLVNLDNKRDNIKSLIYECEKEIDKQSLFFKLADDPDMQRACLNVKNDFTEAEHNLLEIERQIIDYINRIERQSALLKKIRKIKYLKDQLTWKEDTNVLQIVESRNPLWMCKKTYNKLRLSLDMLRRDENACSIIRKIASKTGVRTHGRTEAEPIEEAFLSTRTETVQEINITEMWNAFLAQGKDLFNFIINFNYSQPRTTNDHVILYCQMATGYEDRLTITNQFKSFENIEYALIYANKHSKDI